MNYRQGYHIITRRRVELHGIQNISGTYLPKSTAKLIN